MKTTIILKKKDTNLSSFVSRFIILIIVFNTVIVLGQSNSCIAELKVEKDRNTRSTPADGTYYAMLISNKGNSAQVFSLSSLNITNCSNSDGSSSEKNVNLESVFLDKNRNLIKKISVKSGETISFFVHILVPSNTPFDKWCCTQITANSISCENYKVDTILHTLFINPNDN